MNQTKPVVAAFDFDGTITTRDTFVPFLALAFGRVRVGLAFASLAGEALKVVLKRSDRDRFKARIIGRLFPGHSVPSLRRVGDAHARAVEALFRPAALERIAWHRSQGHRLVMVSASLDLYLEPVAARLGFDDLLCTRPAGDPLLFDGGMDGANCRGAEKVRRLEGLLGDLTQYELHAYGDSAGDREMLEVADVAYYRPFE
ncbi:HAD-IB family hydrolase [Thiocystis violascens]|uniref:HAD-superfamily subfamily IB hydrolase, TIGR01490 n=1 Tax=Thiocystis violascens (strain ATCC 17096 / DSM 198 / 6111) TaxID=765911 RepID=I3YCV4_THIV6|nr:HAD-IB family hydrolase [Thiocystis violascens]AFL74822.1 HAD-superfamily subfamily IB hydrolase, TIGR01490 [Thiocystis violascens DSM 198]